MIATSAMRVPANTSPESQDRINRQLRINVDYFARHPDQIDRRLKELDDEWDIERVLETGSSAVTLAGLTLSILRRRRWILLSLAVQGFFMQHALQGWCPPLPLLRRLNFRTRREIDQERYALKALRGDFRDISANQNQSAEKSVQAVSD